MDFDELFDKEQGEENENQDGGEFGDFAEDIFSDITNQVILK